MALRGYLTAAVLSFAHTIGEFGVVLMVGGNIPGRTKVISIAIYEHVETIDYQAAHILSAGLLVFSFFVLLTVYTLNRRFPGSCRLMPWRPLELDVSLDYPGFSLRFAEALPLAGITGLFGPSGSGKSTLLRIIAGLERNARGRVAFDGEVWQAGAGRHFVPPHRRGVGYVFQETRLFPHLTVAGNLAYAERRSRHTGNAIHLADVVDALDLKPLLGRRTTGLSGGERQRVAIARTLLSRPRLLLMDEPLAALDYRRKGEILPYIERLPGTFGLPMIYVSHAIDEVSRLAERLILMASGAKTAVGSTIDLLSRLDLQPVTGRFEAGALLTARLIDHDPVFRLSRLTIGDQDLLMPEVDMPPGSEVRLRVRARDVALATGGPWGSASATSWRASSSRSSPSPRRRSPRPWWTSAARGCGPA